MSNEYVVMPKEDWLAILDAMRAKEGSTNSILSGELAAKIEAIETGADVSGVTATAGDVLSPKVIVGADGNEVSGTIVTRTESDGSSSGATVSFPAGYYANTHGKTVNNGALAQPSYTYSNGVITAKSAVGTSGYISYGATSNGTTISDSNLVASNIKSGVSIFGVAGELEPGITPSITYPYGGIDIGAGESYNFEAGAYLPDGYVIQGVGIRSYHGEAVGSGSSTEYVSDAGAYYHYLPIFLDGIWSNVPPTDMYIVQQKSSFDEELGGIMFAHFVRTGTSTMAPVQVFGHNDSSSTYYWSAPAWMTHSAFDPNSEILADGFNLYVEETSSEQRQFIGTYDVYLYYDDSIIYGEITDGEIIG